MELTQLIATGTKLTTHLATLPNHPLTAADAPVVREYQTFLADCSMAMPVMADYHPVCHGNEYVSQITGCQMDIRILQTNVGSILKILRKAVGNADF